MRISEEDISLERANVVILRRGSTPFERMNTIGVIQSESENTSDMDVGEKEVNELPRTEDTKNIIAERSLSDLKTLMSNSFSIGESSSSGTIPGGNDNKGSFEFSQNIQMSSLSIMCCRRSVNNLGHSIDSFGS